MTEMEVQRSFLLFIALMLMIENDRQVIAYTEIENLVFINKILELLNNNKECKMPTYEEVDELQASFNELDALYGESLTSKLTDDQKLVKETLLDQWESFQRRMAAGVVIRTAKKRAFLGKIERYQQAKYGFSICTSTVENTGPISDHIFERNPIVRYIKHLETKDVPEYNPDDDEGAIGNKAEAIRTPISGVTSRELTPEFGDVRDEVDNLKQDSDELDGSYDPLADIPVPPVVTPPETIIETVADNIKSELEIEDKPETGPQIGIDTQVDSQTGTGIDQIKRENEFEQQHKSEADANVENGTESEPGFGSLSEPIFKDEVEETSNADSDLGNKSILNVQPAVKKIESDSENEHESEIGVLRNESKGAPETFNSKSDEVESGSESEVQLDPKLVSDETGAATENVVQPNQDQQESVMVDDETDLAELIRLTHVDGPVKWWEYDLRLGNLNWPDEKQTSTEYIFDDSIKNEWQKFLSEHEFQEQEEKNNLNAPVEIKRAPFVTYEKKPGKLRNRKKEFMQSVFRDVELRNAEVEFGWAEYPQQGEENRLNQHWITMADNNFCKLNVNRNYLTNSRGVKALKSLVGKDQNAKRRLMY